MKKHMKRLRIFLLSLLGVILAIVLCVFAIIFAASEKEKKNSARAQQAHFAALEADYARPDFIPADEKAMTGFDVDAALRDNLRLNDLRFIATHNSYKAYNAFADKLMERWIVPLGAGYSGAWSYGFEPLSAQLDRGIRSFELDVMREKDGLRCAHIPLIDYASVCADYALAMQELALWSEHHPGHLPITVLVEAKDTILSGGMVYHEFNFDDVLYLEKITADALGARLYIPQEMLGEHENFLELRTLNSYPLLSALLGRIIVIYHYEYRGTTAQYAVLDPAEHTHKMFLSAGQWMAYAGLDTNPDYACFMIDNNSTSRDIAVSRSENNFLVRTRSDTWPWHIDAWGDEALATGAFILTTDYPPRGALGTDAHVFTFEGGATVTRGE